jgi:hypothetical protein
MDASGEPTANVSPGMAGKLEFARAYALGQDALRLGTMGWLPDIRAAYDSWQKTGGRTIYGRS